MSKKLQQIVKPFFKTLLIFCLVFTFILSNADAALAARSGGRIGGGSFRVPTRSAPRTYAPPGGGYSGYPGGGFGFPFLLPFWGIGGGFSGLFGILIFIAIANFITQSFRRAASYEQDEYGYSNNSPVSVTRLQVGLLAQARNLQKELDTIAQTSDTNSPQGRAEVLQETSLALLRHPEYWVYAGGGTQQAKLAAAETEFNRLTLAERSKFTEETLTNVNNQLKASTPQASLPGNDEIDNPTELISQGPGEYIIVTLICATLGKFQIPDINSSDELRQALRQIGSISGDKLLAIEVLWTPQAEGDTLTTDDILEAYTDIKLV